SEGARQIPEETALALTYNGGTYAVMMGTPRDLRDFAIGFSLSEGVVQSANEIASLDIIELDDGIELRLWLAPQKATPNSGRRRRDGGGHWGSGSRGGGGAPRRDRAAWPLFLATRDHGGNGGTRSAAGDQYRDPDRARRRVLDTRAGHCRAARGCRPPQCARQ